MMNKVFSAPRLRILAAVLLAGLAGGVFLKDAFGTTSIEAILNGRALVLRAPLDGRLMGKLPAVGDMVAAGDPLAQIRVFGDPAAALDRAKLEAELEGARKRVEGLREELVRISALRQELADRAEDWELASAVRAQRKHEAAIAAHSAATERAETAGSEFERMHKIAATGAVSQIDLRRAETAAAEARADLAVMVAEVERSRIEAESSRKGLNLTDGQNDVTYSRQKLADLLLRSAEILTRIAEAETQARGLRAQKEIFDRALSLGHPITAPADAVMYRRLVGAGSDVIRGQEIMVLVDCSDLFIEARLTMKEAAGIEIGSSATIEVAGRPGSVHGVVRSVRGWAAGASIDDGASFLQQPRADRDAIIEIGIRSEDLRIGDDGYCSIGAAAKVRFDDVSVISAFK